MSHAWALIALIAWAALWAVGGIWMARAAFRLTRGELLLVGLALGIAAENLLANLLARLLPLPAAFWAAAALTALLGLLMALREGKAALIPLKELSPLPWGTLVALLLLCLLATSLGRGLAIFDDFAHLPVVSLMAAGDIPPHFPLDPGVPYEYHYFILLFAASVMRIGGLYAWTALDLSRGLACGLALVLAFQWSRRVTRSATAGVLGAAFVAFASGARWLLLLLPGGLLNRISAVVTLLGSGAGSGPTLTAALASPWAVEGAGPLAFPFAYVSGVNQPGVLSQFVANGLTETAFVLALLLTLSRWRFSKEVFSEWRGVLASGLILSSMMLLTEAGVLLELGGWGLIVLILVFSRRSLRLPRSLWAWAAAVLGGNLAGALLGGALPGAITQALGQGTADSHHTIGFQLVFPPTLVSAHLGVLSLANPGQLAAALAELGPLILALPLVAFWGWKALRAGRWYEAALSGEAILSLGMLFVQFNGSEGVRNTARLYRFFFVLSIFALPLGWNWAKARGPALRWAAAAAAAAALLGGLVIFGLALPAAQHPIATYFVDALDSQMTERYWNRLEPGALVFDPDPFRAPTILGRFTDSSTTWYASKPAWQALSASPLPARLNAAGFTYVYFDDRYFEALDPSVRAAWGAPCVRLEGTVQNGTAWRSLYDVRTCR